MACSGSGGAEPESPSQDTSQQGSNGTDPNSGNNGSGSNTGGSDGGNGSGSTGGDNQEEVLLASPPEHVAAARLLNQSTYGASYADIEYVSQLGQQAWLNEQFSLPVELHLPLVSPYAEHEDFSRLFRMAAWWHKAVNAQDQLRQRVAFALSEIFVTSEHNAILFDEPEAMTNYYDLLLIHAFGNYRDLLEAVTLSPVMGAYLSMLGNEKPDAERNIRPDENYAREVMQLFTIGLVELNLDGTVKTDSQGNAIATYNQDIIKGFAHVFTGWHFNGTTAESWWNWRQNFNLIEPMSAVEFFHDKEEKLLLSNILLPAGQTAQEDLDQALDVLFTHSNVAPFISKQLIQRLVTSNPSTGYVERVASVFENNGLGTRGDLQAVVQAILMDEEARNGHILMPDEFGKYREPLIVNAHMWRAFDLHYQSEIINLGWPEYFFSQAPLASPSVFNFFRPDYGPSSLQVEHSLFAPELQIVTESSLTRSNNYFAWSVLARSFVGDTAAQSEVEDDELALDFSELHMILEQQGVDVLLEHLNLLLTADNLSPEAKQVLRDSYNEQPWLEPNQQIGNLIYLIMSSPQYLIQR